MTYALSGLEGKVAVVTGAARMRSIGRSIAVRLADAGCDVVLTGTQRDPSTFPAEEQAAGWTGIDAVVGEIEARGRRALPTVLDIADAASIAGVADAAMATFGRVDILVNNASASRGEDRKPVLDLDPALWRTVIDVNLTGSFLMSQTFGRLMVDGGRGGSIVNISSIAGKRFDPNTAAYAASKAGLHTLTACMAQEVGRHGVRVNAICPGMIDTSRLDDIGRGSDRWNAIIDGGIPLGRVGTGDDIAATTLYLCSDDGSWVTGQCWNVDGGSVVQH